MKKLFSLLLGITLLFGSFFAANAASADTFTVKMGSDGGQLVFEPKVLTIKPGDSVQWVNNKAFPHNVVFESGPDLSHKKLMMKPKQAVESTFTEPGEYSYYCSPHRGAGMVGKIVVAG
jgi:plastocyanin